jgi:hypothetical protein
MNSSGAAVGLVVGAASILLFVTAAMVSTREFASARDPVSPPDWIARLVAGDVVLGLSTGSQRDDLDNCYEMMGSAYALSRPTVERHQIAEACSTLATGIAAWSPSNAQAWLVAAAASAQLDDFGAFNTRLLQSQITGPHEQWVAEMRVELGEAHYAQLDSETRANHLADLAMLVHSLSGIRSIAERYLNDPGFRERIVAIVETLPEVEQRRFLENVKMAAFDPPA